MEVVCSGCGRIFVRSPRHPSQSYCSSAECQRKRKARWQKLKMSMDADYRLNQRTSQEKWVDKNPGYWKSYRQRKPEQAKRNRLMQAIRNRRRKKAEPIAKMDALKVNIFGIPAP